MTKIKCNECNKELKDNDLFTYGVENYCESCFNDLFGCCDDCGENFNRDDLNCFNDYNYCFDCLDNISVVCDDCSERVLTEDTHSCHCCDSVFCEDCYCSCDEDNNNSNFNQIKIPFEKQKSNKFKNNIFKDFCGVEIETQNNDLRNNQFNFNDLMTYQFNQIEDGSLNSCGVEFVSNAFQGDLLYDKVKLFCNELKNKDYFVNSDCGLHIHIKVSKRIENLKKILMFYKKYEDYFYLMVSQSRQHNNFNVKYDDKYNLSEDDILKLKSNTELKKILYHTKRYNNIKRYTKDKYNSLRYGWFNLHSVFFRGTLEIRLHNGTINPTKINNWFKIHLTILNLLKNININMVKEFPKTPQFFLSLFDDDIKKYVVERWRELNKENNFLDDDIKNILNLKEIEVKV